MEDADASPDHPLQIETLESLAVSGLATKAANFADTFIFSKLFEKVYKLHSLHALNGNEFDLDLELLEKYGCYNR